MNTTKQVKNEGAKQIYSLRNTLGSYEQVLPTTACVSWFTSNHDENSWNGTEYERYGEMAIPLAVFSSMYKGIHLIYSGQELPNLKRLQFFDKDCIEWNKKPTLHGFYKKLFSFRKENQVFDCDPSKIKCQFTRNSVEHHVFSFVRKYNDNAVMVLINFSGYPLHNVEVDVDSCQGVFQELFTSLVQSFDVNHQYFHLQPWGYQVWYN
jgi:glycosidase